VRRLVPFIFLLACSEYEIRKMSPSEDRNWFDDARMQGSDADDPEGPVDEDESDDGNHWEDDDSNDDSDDDSNDESDHDEDDSDGEDWSDDEEDDDWSGGDDHDDEEDDGGSGGSDDSGPITARAPWIGEMVISELMIDPDSVDDQQGEWVELHNVTGHWLDITGHRLADGDLDDMEIDATGASSLIVPPGGLLVICAEEDYWDNGGVECDGTFRWWTFGGGFAMSNTEDEILLRDPDGITLDRVYWAEGFAEVGSAMGLDPDEHSISDNDDLDHWCDQWAYLPFGDAGTPGESNDTCW